jgi:hypothetical protein
MSPTKAELARMVYDGSHPCLSLVSLRKVRRGGFWQPLRVGFEAIITDGKRETTGSIANTPHLAIVSAVTIR